MAFARPWAAQVFLGCAAVWAQTVSPTATVQGTVSDPLGAPIAGVRITARQTSIHIIRSTESDGSGQFFLRGLPAGEWALVLECAGFAPLEVKGFDLAVGEVAVRRLTMALAGAVERVEVTERPDVVESTATSSSAAVSSNRVEDAPAHDRSYVNFVALTPGAVASPGSGFQRSMTGIRNPLADSGFSFAGMRGRNNSINIDGVDNRDETTGGNRVGIGVEMVQEFRVASVAVGAEFGGAAGGMVNVVTRTGANIRHGDFTFFGQEGALNARRADVGPGAHPRFQRYQPGASTSGPIRRDRTFFFAALEYEHERAQEWSETPEEAAAAINAILASRRFAGIPVTAVRRGLFDTGERGVEFSLKVNHQVGERDSLSARYALSRGRVLNDVQGVENFQDVSASGSSLTSDQSLVGNWLRVLSPNVVNEARVQVARRSQQMQPNSGGALLEIPGVVSFGQSYRLNAARTEDHAEAVENLHFGRGRHQMTAGVDLHDVRLEARLANRFGGIYIFPTLADFEAGLPDVYLQSFGRPETHMAPLETGAWWQDRWQPLAGLTVEAGVRFDRETMPAGFPPPANNVAPRLGVAWKASAKRALVVRAGFGLFYDRYPLAFLNEAIQKDGTNGFEQYGVGPWAAAVFATAGGGSPTGPEAALPRSEYRVSSRFPSTYSRKVSFGAEQGWGKDTTITLEAKAVDGYHLPRLRNIAEPLLPPLYLLEQTARSQYRGVSAAVNRRLSKNLTYLFTYDLGSARDDGSDFTEQPSDPRNIRADWARSRQYQLQRLTASGVYELPEERVAELPGALRAVVDDLSIAPILVAGTGRPLNALLTTDAWRTGAYPLTARPAGFGRNPYFAAGTVSMDARLMKTFKVMNGRAVVQFGVEAFNLFNHFLPGKVSDYYAAGARRLDTYGGSIEPGSARQVQLMMQFEY